MRRPICVVCLLMMLSIVLLKNWEFSFMGKAPNSVLAEKTGQSLDEALKDQAEVQVSGIIERRSQSEKTTTLYLKKAKVKLKEQIFSVGKLKIFLKDREELMIGSGVKVKGVLEEISGPRNPGEFDRKSYEACRHVYYQVKKGVVLDSYSQSSYGEWLERLRENWGKILERNAGEQAGILEAMVLGEKSSLEKETKTLYQMAGIVHILAISGLHLSMIGMGLFSGLKLVGLGNGMAGWLSLLVIYQYGLLTGGSIATLRAVMMMMLAIGAKVLGRTYDLLTALAVSAMLLLLDSPEHLWSSGFLLSFGAVLGMGAVYPILQKYMQVKKEWQKTLLASLSVQLVTLPIQLWFYYEVSFCGIFLNLLVIPTVVVALLSGIAGILLGSFWTAGARAVLLPGRWLLMVYDRLCEESIRIPFGIWTPGRPLWWQVVIYYGILLGLLYFFGVTEPFSAAKEKRRRTQRSVEKDTKMCKSGWLLELCLWIRVSSGFLLAVWILGLPQKPQFSITCLDIGQGDAIVCTTEAGKVFLCDGGSSSQSSVGSYQILPYLKYKGYSDIDGIFVSHTDADHISGIREILELQASNLTSVKVRNLYLPDWKNPPEEYEQLCSLAQQAKISVTRLKKGQHFSDGTMEIRVLYPEAEQQAADINESCLVLQLIRGSFCGLLTGDIGAETEEKLLPELSACAFLKVGHHGSGGSSSEAFLSKLSPKAAFISCSATNTYGHPSPETLERLQQAGAKIYITKDCGAITLTVTDQGMRISRHVK